jgi:hypothetical protein
MERHSTVLLGDESGGIKALYVGGVLTYAVALVERGGAEGR